MTVQDLRKLPKSLASGNVPTGLMAIAGAAMYAVGCYFPDQRAFTDTAVLSIVGSMLNAGRVGLKRSNEQLPDAVSDRLWQKIGAQGSLHETLAAAVAENRARCDESRARIEHAEKRLDNHDHHIRTMSPALKQVADKMGVRYEPIVNLIGPQ